MKYQNELARLVNQRMANLHLNYEEVSYSIGKYPLWITILLNHDKDKLPPGTREEFKALFRLLSPSKPLERIPIKVEGKKPKTISGVKIPEMVDVDENAYLEIMASVFDDIEAPGLYTPIWSTERLKTHYRTLKEKSKVWIVTPIMSQADNFDVAVLNARGFAEREIKTTFFIPIDDRLWLKALKNIKTAFDELPKDPSKSDIKKYLRIFGISVPTGPPLIITRPHTQQTKVLLSIQGWGSHTGHFIVMDTFTVFKDLLLYQQLEGVGETLPNPVEKDTFAETTDPVSRITVKRFYPREL